jgi:hypothetical protein
MPLSIPAFDQYQAPIIPLRGLWHSVPKEGDHFVNAEVDWLVTTKSSAVQFSLSGNSPIALSQIIALSVDNGRCGVDVVFIFPDSGFVLTVAAHSQGIYPVFTNALTFYASAPGAAVGDTTVMQILNSMPPPVPIPPTRAQNHAGVTGVALQTNSTTAILPASITGTLNSLSISVSKVTGASAGQASLALVDGAGKTVWYAVVYAPASSQVDENIAVSGLSVRFTQGLNLTIASTTFTGGAVVVNSYYTTP